jgi:hypothetical protein
MTVASFRNDIVKAECLVLQLGGEACFARPKGRGRIRARRTFQSLNFFSRKIYSGQ